MLERDPCKAGPPYWPPLLAHRAEGCHQKSLTKPPRATAAKAAAAETALRSQHATRSSVLRLLMFGSYASRSLAQHLHSHACILPPAAILPGTLPGLVRHGLPRNLPQLQLQLIPPIIQALDVRPMCSCCHAQPAHGTPDSNTAPGRARSAAHGCSSLAVRQWSGLDQPCRTTDGSSHHGLLLIVF